MLHDVEFFNTLAISKVPGHKYPQDQINENWKTVLVNQFHDVLPGSSIAEVYQDSSAEYAQVLDSSKEHLNAALTALAARVGPHLVRNSLFNPSPGRGVEKLFSLD